MKIYQLAYHSICSPHINAIDLKDILVKALDFNEKNKITGCLVKYKSEFIQIIESENQEVIHQLFDKIKVDQRHHAVTLLYTGFKSSRDYINWTMGFFNLNTSQVELIAETHEVDNKCYLKGLATELGLENMMNEVIDSFDPII